MIPAFPEFKIVGVDDREAVESHTHTYPPYSDFNFTSLWAWDTSNERMISELNGNLVVRFSDYKTNEPFLSFLGSNEIEQTAHELIRYAEASGISPILRFMPEESVVGMKTATLTINEDRDNFDYLYAIEELAALRGQRFKSKRLTAERFTRAYPSARVEVEDLENAEMQQQVVSILRHWEDNKNQENKEYELQHEEASINRLFQTARAHKLIVVSIFIDGRMIGFSIDELLPNRYAIEHFSKADSTYKGIYDFLNERMARHLEGYDVLLWNWEQDLGVESMRKSKMSYRPVNFLKKYTVSLSGEK